MLFALFLSITAAATSPSEAHLQPLPNAVTACTHARTASKPNLPIECHLRHFRDFERLQEPSQKSELDKVLDRLKQFDKQEQSAMIESVTETMLVQPHLLFERIAQAREELQKKPAKKLREFAPKSYDANEFAPALKLRTRKYKPSQSRWKSFAKKYSNPLAPPLDPNFWQWSFGEQGLIAPEKEHSAESQVRGMWTGKWPQTDLLQAQVLAYLDDDSSMRAVAHYFEHSYRDRDGRLYLGFTLEQVWASGLKFGVSDVETIAFLRLILNDDKVQSPIKASMHDGLYSLIEDSFADFREYKQLRQALAARFLNPQGEVPPILQGTVKQFDVAWALCDFQLPQMRRLLKSNPSRKKFLAAVEKLKQSGDVSTEELQQRLDLLHSFPTAIAQAAYLGLKREGLLGLHKR
jgi:hypothetical protein